MGSFFDTYHWHIPFYKLSMSKTPVAMIFTPGRQIELVKLRESQKFFIHKEFGLFEIKQEFVFFINKVAVYFFDTRNQNPLNLPLMNELYKWAYQNKMSVITRQNIRDGINLRIFGKDKTTEKNKEKIKIIEKKIDKIKKESLEHNIKRRKTSQDDIEGLDAEEPEITEKEITFKIIKIMLNDKIIDFDKALMYQRRLSSGDLQINDFIDELKEFEKITVNFPLEHRLDMVLPDFHTYNPKDILGVISMATKIDKGLKHLRVKPLKGGFNPAYILFGIIGAVIFLMMMSNGSIDLGGMLGSQP